MNLFIVVPLIVQAGTESLEVNAASVIESRRLRRSRGVWNRFKP